MGLVLYLQAPPLLPGGMRRAGLCVPGQQHSLENLEFLLSNFCVCLSSVTYALASFTLDFLTISLGCPSLFKPFVPWEVACVPYSFHLSISGELSLMFSPNTFLSHHSQADMRCFFYSFPLVTVISGILIPFLHCAWANKIFCPLVKREWCSFKTGIWQHISCKGMVLGKWGTLHKSIDCQKRET